MINFTGFEAKTGIKPIVAGEVAVYVRDFKDARICPVIIWRKKNEEPCRSERCGEG
jgi:hypothetical protein